MCTVLLPPGVNPTAVNKICHIISYEKRQPNNGEQTEKKEEGRTEIWQIQKEGENVDSRSYTVISSSVGRNFSLLALT